jgi:hypothetical protein
MKSTLIALSLAIFLAQPLSAQADECNEKLKEFFQTFEVAYAEEYSGYAQNIMMKPVEALVVSHCITFEQGTRIVNALEKIFPAVFPEGSDFNHNQ